LAYGIHGSGGGGVISGVLDWIGGLELPGPGGRSNLYWDDSRSAWSLFNWGDPLSFSGAELGRGRTPGRVAYGVAIGATSFAVVVGTAELCTGNAPTQVLPPRGTRIIGIRNPNWWNGQPIRWDYGPLPRKGGEPQNVPNPPRHHWHGPPDFKKHRPFTPWTPRDWRY
jgi:hypothetical protein